MTRDEQPAVAFVLSGGASLGAIQVGMLRALYERDLLALIDRGCPPEVAARILAPLDDRARWSR